MVLCFLYPSHLAPSPGVGSLGSLEALVTGFTRATASLGT